MSSCMPAPEGSRIRKSKVLIGDWTSGKGQQSDAVSPSGPQIYSNYFQLSKSLKKIFFS